jgi:hypothetical protein
MRKTLVLTAFAAAALAAGTLVGPASATHVRPKAATPIYASMVPAYEPCGAPNRVHAAPLAYGSCNPPVQTSPNITMGTPDANGAAANAIGYIKVTVTNGPGASDADVAIVASATDIRCRPGVATCSGTNTAGGPDYVGTLLGSSSLNISDHNNATCAPCPGPPTSPFTETGTGSQPSFPILGTCTATADPAIGAACGTITTANSTAPGVIVEGKRGIVEIGQFRVFDAGPSGSAPPGSLFAVQGIFIP